MSPQESSAAHGAAVGPVTEIKSSAGLFSLDLAGVWRYRELLLFLVLRDLKVRYKQAALGVLWSVIQPVFTVLVFTVIFGQVARLPSDGAPYALFSFAAVLPWTLFAEAMRRSAMGLVGDATLISKVYFPRLVVPLANVLTPSIDFVVTLVVFMVVMLLYGMLPTAGMLLLPVLFIITVLMGLAFGLWLGPINVRFRDVTHTMPLLIQLWMYATPIVYPLSMIPERWQAIYSINPMVGLVEAYRWALLGIGEFNGRAILIGFIVMVVILAGGLVFFKRSERAFADII
jgi:lipopolysaccharide transport system permease protein